MAQNQKVQEFIDFRSQGLSFGRIAEQLGVAKSTLIIPKVAARSVLENGPISVSFGEFQRRLRGQVRGISDFRISDLKRVQMMDRTPCGFARLHLKSGLRSEYLLATKPKAELKHEHETTSCACMPARYPARNAFPFGIC